MTRCCNGGGGGKYKKIFITIFFFFFDEYIEIYKIDDDKILYSQIQIMSSFS